MAQYGLRLPEFSTPNQAYVVGKETHQLSLVPEEARGKGHGWALLMWIHELMQDFATHTQKSVVIRHVVAKPSLVEKLKSKGFEEKPEEREPGAAIMVKTLNPQRKNLDMERKSLVEKLLPPAQQ